jgi:hypothetical protein
MVYINYSGKIQSKKLVSSFREEDGQNWQKSLQLRSPPPLGLAVTPFAGQAGQAFAANGGNLHHCLLHWDMWSSKQFVFLILLPPPNQPGDTPFLLRQTIFRTKITKDD